MLDEGKENPGMTFASSLAYDAIEAAMLANEEVAVKAKTPEPKAGSYEKFMSMLGNTGGSRG